MREAEKKKGGNKARLCPLLPRLIIKVFGSIELNAALSIKEAFEKLYNSVLRTVKP